MIDIPIDQAITFLRENVAKNNELKSLLNERGSSIITLNMEPRHRLYVFYTQLIDSFNMNTEFITDIIEWNNTHLEPLRAPLRTITELYAKTLYMLSVSDSEKIKRVIGETLWTFSRRIDGDVSLISVDRAISDSEGLHLPTVEEIASYNRRERHSFKDTWTLEGISGVATIRNFHDETAYPIVSRDSLESFFDDYSKQVHGNVFYNMPNLPLDVRYQLIFSTMNIQIHFQRALSVLIQEEERVQRHINQIEKSNVFALLMSEWEVVRSRQPHEL